MIKNLIKNVFTPLLQRIMALEYSLGLIADYVVESGTSGTGVGACGIELYRDGSATQTPLCYILRPNTLPVATQYSVHINAIGRWK